MLNLNKAINLSSPDNRKPAAEAPANRLAPYASRPVAGFPPAAQAQINPGQTARAYSAEQFLPGGKPAATQQTNPQAGQPSLPQALNQALGGFNLNQIAGQVAMYFKGNTRDVKGKKVDDEEQLQRERQDAATPDVMGGQKVEQSSGSSMGGGGQ